MQGNMEKKKSFAEMEKEYSIMKAQLAQCRLDCERHLQFARNTMKTLTDLTILVHKMELDKANDLAQELFGGAARKGPHEPQE